MSIGNLIDSLYNLRASRLELDNQVKELKSQEAKLKEEIIEALKQQGLASGRGAAATATITYSEEPKVTDWGAVYGYIANNDMFELLHRRISTTLWRALEADGNTVPGIESMAVTDLSLTKAQR